MLSVGTDIEENGRFVELCENARFMQRVFTADERAYILSKPNRAKTAAGLFCAKEAVAKALGEGLFGLQPADLEVTRDARGAPAVVLHGRAAQTYGTRHIALSISHTDAYSTATAVVTERP